MLRTTTTRSAGNLPSDMAENAEVEGGTSSTTRSAKNSPLDMSEDVEVCGNGNRGDDKTFEKSPFKKPSGLIGYFISLRSKKNYTDV